MKADVKRQWLEALRSGEYTQGQGYLSSSRNVSFTSRKKPQGQTYCCLGVLCDLAVKAGVPVKTVVEAGVTRYDGMMAYLPDSVLNWAGPRGLTNSGRVSPKVLLSELNDKGVTFEEIANLIEENVVED